MTSADDDDAPLRLSDISTSWRKVGDASRFALTYSTAARAYLLAMLRDADAADEVLQEVLVQVTERGFPTADPARGRFRDYLKAVLRNAAARHHRPWRAAQADDELLASLPAAVRAVEEAWQAEWRTCVLNAAWRALERHQRTAKRGNLAFTVLRLTADHPDLDSPALAAMAAEKSGQPLSAVAFRQQFSRARRTFAELIVAEVRQSLDGGTDAEVRDELADLRLLQFVRDYLPPE